MVALFLAAFVVDHPFGQIPLVVLLLGLAVWTRSWSNLYRLRILIGLIFVMTFLIWTFFYGPDGNPPLLAVGGFAISHTAPWFALGMAAKLVVILCAGILFLSVTRIEELAYALNRVGLPYKIGFTMSLAFRLVPVFVDAADTVVQAQRCRGLDFDRGGLWERLRRYIPVIVPVFMGGLRRADNMAMALEARGFQSQRQRTTLAHYELKTADGLALLVLGAIVGLYLYLWWNGSLRIG
jgi:energy-coupling factor transport system permease protein